MTSIQHRSQQTVFLCPSTMLNIIVYNLNFLNEKASFWLIDAAEFVSRISICGRQAI